METINNTKKNPEPIYYIDPGIPFFILIDHGKIDHGKIDHGKIDHGKNFSTKFDIYYQAGLLTCGSF